MTALSRTIEAANFAKESFYPRDTKIMLVWNMRGSSLRQQLLSGLPCRGLDGGGGIDRSKVDPETEAWTQSLNTVTMCC